MEVIVSARRSPFVNFFLLVWLVGWSIGEIEIAGKLISHEAETPDAFMVFWAFGWTLGGLLAVFIYLYNMKGREIIRISAITNNNQMIPAAYHNIGISPLNARISIIIQPKITINIKH